MIRNRPVWQPDIDTSSKIKFKKNIFPTFVTGLHGKRDIFVSDPNDLENFFFDTFWVFLCRGHVWGPAEVVDFDENNFCSNPIWPPKLMNSITSMLNYEPVITSSAQIKTFQSTILLDCLKRAMKFEKNAIWRVLIFHEITNLYHF